MVTTGDFSDIGTDQYSRMTDGEQGAALRKHHSTPTLKGPGKPPKIPNRLPRIQSNTSSDFSQLGASTAGSGPRKETAMQMVDRLLAKARGMKAEMADQKRAVADMRSDIQEEYRLAGVVDPAVGQAPEGPGSAHLHIEASFAPIINVPVDAGRSAALQSEVEYQTHEL
jgi:hypothetical protein